MYISWDGPYKISNHISLDVSSPGSCHIHLLSLGLVTRYETTYIYLNSKGAYRLGFCWLHSIHVSLCGFFCAEDVSWGDTCH